jgi:hypothetical protein
MSADPFDLIEQAVRSEGPRSALALLTAKFRGEKNYPLLFETRLMEKRHELGLPLIQLGAIDDLPADKRPAYQQGVVEAARETGALFLADGDILRAWPYYRAIGDRAPIARAIEALESADEMEGVIDIALGERVHPRKGFELLLARHGLCRAITYFEGSGDIDCRQDCINLMVRGLHSELVLSLQRAISQREDRAPDTHSIPELMAGRDWLFGEYDAYVDTSHLVGIVRFTPDLEDAGVMRLALELCHYGTHLSGQFKLQGDPPFDDLYVDHAVYLRALLGENVEGAIAHFRAKIADTGPGVAGSGPAQVLVVLLVRLRRYPEAVQVSLGHLSDFPPNQLACPSVFQLCQLAGDSNLLRKLARERGDLVSFAAGLIGPGCDRGM